MDTETQDTTRAEGGAPASAYAASKGRPDDDREGNAEEESSQLWDDARRAVMDDDQNANALIAAGLRTLDDEDVRVSLAESGALPIVLWCVPPPYHDAVSAFLTTVANGEPAQPDDLAKARIAAGLAWAQRRLSR